MKVTQGNKGPAVSTAVGVESSTQEFPARLPSPGGLLPCIMRLYPHGLVVMPLGSRLSFDSQVPSGNPVSPSAAASVMGGGGVSAASYIPAPEDCGSSWRRTKGWGSLPPTPPTSWGDLASLIV